LKWRDTVCFRQSMRYLPRSGMIDPTMLSKSSVVLIHSRHSGDGGPQCSRAPLHRELSGESSYCGAEVGTTQEDRSRRQNHGSVSVPVTRMMPCGGTFQNLVNNYLYPCIFSDRVARLEGATHLRHGAIAMAATGGWLGVMVSSISSLSTHHQKIIIG
jgi:hypothetical protein